MTTEVGRLVGFTETSLRRWLMQGFRPAHTYGAGKAATHFWDYADVLGSMVIRAFTQRPGNEADELSGIAAEIRRWPRHELIRAVVIRTDAGQYRVTVGGPVAVRLKNNERLYVLGDGLQTIHERVPQLLAVEAAETKPPPVVFEAQPRSRTAHNGYRVHSVNPVHGPHPGTREQRESPTARRGDEGSPHAAPSRASGTVAPGVARPGSTQLPLL